MRQLGLVEVGRTGVVGMLRGKRGLIFRAPCPAPSP